MFEGRVFEGRALEGRVFKGRVFEERVFEGRVFEGRASKGRVFEGCVLEGRALEGCAFEGRVLAEYDGKKPVFEEPLHAKMQVDSRGARKAKKLCGNAVGVALHSSLA